VIADMVDSSTYYDLASKYRVMGVPTTMANGKLRQMGAAPEAQMVSLVMRAAQAHA
jgi:protein-disulfide isomerase